MKNYQCIFFDLDGTLSDSAPGLINSVSYAMEKMGIAVENKNELRRFIGPPLMESMVGVFGLEGGRATQAVNYFREYFQTKGILENEMYPGIQSVLDRLRTAGKRLMVATSKPEVFAKQIIARYGITDYFEFIGGSELDEKTRATKAEVIAYVLENCKITDPSNVLMVGDRSHDIEGARKNGMDCLGCRFGYAAGTELEDCGAAYIAEAVEDIANLILN